MDNMLKEINSVASEIQQILEGFGFSSMEELVAHREKLVEMWGNDNGESAAQARAGEREWARNLGQSWNLPKDAEVRNREARPQPAPGDVVEHNGQLLRLENPNAQGEFPTINIRTGARGMNFLPQFLMGKFQPQAGKGSQQGRHMWVARSL